MSLQETASSGDMQTSHTGNVTEDVFPTAAMLRNLCYTLTQDTCVWVLCHLHYRRLLKETCVKYLEVI